MAFSLSRAHDPLCLPFHSFRLFHPNFIDLEIQSSNMKSRSISLVTLALFVAAICNGQLMDRLKKRAEEKGIEVSDEVTYDRSAYDPNMDVSDGDDYEALEIEAVSDFYNKDVVMALYDNNGNLTQTSYFDAEGIVVRTEMANGT